MIEGKLSPQDLEIEQAVLSSLLQEKNAIYEVMNVLDAACFYKDEHQKIYQAILDLCHENKGIDLLTVTNKLRTLSQLEEIGGPLFITQLSSKVSSTYNLKTHAEILKELAIKRGLITISHNIEEMAYDDEQEAPAVMSKIESDLYKLSSFSTSKDFVSIVDPLHLAIEDIEKSENQQLTGIRSGFSRLDFNTGGWQNTDLIILGGRPSMGKTLIAIHNILTAAEWGTAVGFFSVEMSQRKIAGRMINSLVGLSTTDIRQGLKPEHWGAIEVATRKIEGFKDTIFIDDTPSLPLLEAMSKARRLKMKRNIGLLVIDYLQLMRVDDKSRKSNKDEQIGMITSGLKSLAKELDIPIILLSQLNRATEMHGDKRPILSNLRESGNIEQDADLVIFAHRPEYYKDPDCEHCVGELIIAKQRNGPTLTVPFRYSENMSKVYDY